jgi:hypothetical protein
MASEAERMRHRLLPWCLLICGDRYYVLLYHKLIAKRPQGYHKPAVQR